MTFGGCFDCFSAAAVTSFLESFLGSLADTLFPEFARGVCSGPPGSFFPLLLFSFLSCWWEGVFAATRLRKSSSFPFLSPVVAC